MQKYAGNVAAIKTLKALEAEHRDATPEEQKILARYVGWGGLKQAFPAPGASPAKGWEGRVGEIKGLLIPEEHAAAARSIQDAHYTSKAIVDGMWNIARRLGFNGGKVLENSMGVGNFFGLMPEDLRRGAALTGVELDSITARIAKQLYPKARIMGPVGFHEVVFADNTFNLTIGNPPFGAQALYDQSAKHLKGMSIHNFFFAKAIDKLAPGGIHIQVVSRYLMDAETSTTRDYLAHRTRLVGAIRLPWTAFYENANTEVVTDIVVLQKLPEEKWGTEDQSWAKTATIPDPLGGEPMRVNAYYAKHPDMILGTMDRSGEMMFENDITVQPNKDTPLDAQLARAGAALPEGIYERAKPPEAIKALEAAAVAPEDVIEHYSVGQYFEEGGKLFRRDLTPDGSLQATEIHAATPYSEKQAWGDSRIERLRGMIGIREIERALLKAEASDEPDIKLSVLRQKLNTAYDRYVARHGYLNENTNEQIFRADPDATLLLALENNFDRGVSPARAKTLGVKPRKATAEKMPIFTQRVVRPYTVPDKASSPADAVAISIQEKGVIDVPYMAKLLGLGEHETAEAITTGDKPLAYFDPATQSYETAAFYLSGNVKRKYQQARDAGLFDQAEALKAVFPADVKAGDINARMGAPWISREVYERFINHLLGEDAEANIQFVPATGGFAISTSGGDEVMINTKWGANYVTEEGASYRSRNAHDLIARILNNKDMTVWNTDSEGNRYVNKEATQAAQDKADEIRMEFEDWVFKDPAQREPLVQYYNENLNTTIEANWDGSYLTLPGKVPDAVIRLRRHQLNAVARWIRTGKILLDHVVGSGKTFTIVSALMEMKRLGIAKKPMIVVPNHLVEQWAISFYQLYPGAKVLAMRKTDFTKQNRQRMLARVATGDWDAVIFSHSSFGFIDSDRDIVVGHLEEQIAEMQAAITLARETEGKKSRTAAQYQKSLERMRERMKELIDKPKDQLLTFQQLGVDMLTVDESQEFKNLFFTTQRRGVGGFGNPTGSKRAFDMYIKGQWLQKTQNGRGLAFATGTPVSNSLTELFTLQRYMGLDDLKEKGMATLDGWLSAFGVTATEYESNVTGTKYKRKERLRRITNAPEVMQMYKQFTDSVTQEDVKRNYREDNNGQEFPIPKVKGGKPRENVIVDASATQMAISEELQKRMDNLPADPRIDNALAVLSDGRKAALDVRLLDPSAPDEPGSKAATAAGEIYRIYTENTHRSGTQLVFLDLSTPNKHGKKDAVKFLKDARDILGAKNAAPFGDLRAQWKELRGRLQEKMDHMDDEKAEHGIDHIEKFLEQSQEIEAAVTAADSGFSVYDDLRTKLMNLGVPAHEIAFIHDFNGDTRKQELFDMVNGGRIRVLLGSTAKMGAGTNVQRKLVAEHHMDVPWRPSDIEQREGRIIRQGNEFRMADPNFEVEILAYATKPSSDVFFWQTQEQKLMGINSLRNFKGQREIDDVSADSMSAAEMKALASGNPLILEDVQLTESIRKLEAQRRRHISSEQDMQSEVVRYQRYIDQLPPVIARQQVLSDKIDAYRNDPFDGNRPKADMDGVQMNAQEARNHVRDVKAEADKAAYDANQPARAQQAIIEEQAKTTKSGTDEFKKLEAEHAALEKGLVKPKIKVTFDEKEYHGLDAVNTAIVERLGDPEAVRFVMDDKEFIRRSDIQAHIDDVVKGWAEKGAGSATLGTVGGVPVELQWISDRMGQGVKITIDGESAVAEQRKYKLIGGADSEIKADGRAIFDRIQRILRSAHDTLTDNKRRYDQAVKGIAPLKAQLGKPWGKDLELAQKKARVVEVRKLLAGDEEKKGGAPAEPEGEKYSIGAGDRPAANVAAEVSRIAQQIAPQAKLNMVLQYFGEGPAMVRSGALSAARGEVAGSYEAARQLITVSLFSRDPTVTVRHEGVHALKDMGMYTPAEWTVLEREAESHFKKEYKVEDTEESIAQAYGGWRGGRKYGGLIGKAFERMRQFFLKLGNALRGLGYQSAEDVFRRTESGEVGRRPGAKAATEPAPEKFSLDKDLYREQRMDAMKRLQEITGLDDKEFRLLYGKRTRLMSRLRLGAGDTEKITADLADVEKKLQGLGERTPEYADLLSELDRMEEILAEAGGGGAGKPPSAGKPVAAAGEEPYTPIGLVDDLRKIFAPANRGAAAQATAGNLRENLARQHIEIQRAEKRLSVFRKRVDKMTTPERYAFIDAIEHGPERVAALPEDLQPIAKELRSMMDRDRQLVWDTGTGALEHFYENYFPHLWEKPGLAGQLMSRIFARRPLTGPASFLKARTYDFLSQGLDAGLVPVTTNPLDLVLLKHAEMMRYVTGQNVFLEMKADGLARFYRDFKKAPPGWVRINDKIARVRQYSSSEKGFIERGFYYAPEEASRILDNYLQPGLSGNGLYDAWRHVGNMMNSAQLGLSAFHVGFTTIDVMISANALAVRQVMEGHPISAIQSVLKGHNPLEAFWNAYQGDKLIKAALSGDPGLANYVEALIEGGGRLKMDQIYRGSQIGALREAFSAGRYVKSARLFIPTLIDTINKPIFEWLVPRQKLGVFLDVARYELEKNPNMTKAERRVVFAKAWDAVDNRMGEMVYDNLFINRAFKDALMAATRSVGWNWGSLRMAGNVAPEAARYIAGPKAGRTFDQEGKSQDKRTFGNNLAYVIALPYMAALLGAIVQYLYTGEGPKDQKDLFKPRTGKLRPDGTLDRVFLPTYMKDVYAWRNDPYQTAKNKAHPMVQTLFEMLDNKDYYGALIRNPDDAMFKQIKDEILFPAEQMVPFSVRNFQRQQQLSENQKPWYDFIASPSMVGITPVPMALARDEALQEELDRRFRRPALIKKLRKETLQQ